MDPKRRSAGGARAGQDTVLWNDTLMYNIAFGALGRGALGDEADVVRAAEAAQLTDFVARQPSRFNTQVGERGLRLSGGEKQRVAIARAFLKNPPVLILVRTNAHTSPPSPAPDRRLPPSRACAGRSDVGTGAHARSRRRRRRHGRLTAIPLCRACAQDTTTEREVLNSLESVRPSAAASARPPLPQPVRRCLSLSAAASARSLVAAALTLGPPHGRASQAARGRTCLAIAHRLSTVMDADCIVVLHEGRVAELGPHAALLATGGLYAALWQRQLDSVGPGSAPAAGVAAPAAAPAAAAPAAASPAAAPALIQLL